MSISLPPPIDLYFTSEKAHDPSAIDRCFAAGAVVRDEGKTIAGVAAKRGGSKPARNTITSSNHSACRRGTGRWW